MQMHTVLGKLFSVLLIMNTILFFLQIIITISANQIQMTKYYFVFQIHILNVCIRNAAHPCTLLRGVHAPPANSSRYVPLSGKAWLLTLTLRLPLHTPTAPPPTCSCSHTSYTVAVLCSTSREIPCGSCRVDLKGIWHLSATVRVLLAYREMERWRVDRNTSHEFDCWITSAGWCGYERGSVSGLAS